MTTRWAGARNAGFAAATALILVLLFLQPTSTNGGRPGTTLADELVTIDANGDVLSTGPAVPTEYGPVRVRARIRDGRIVRTVAVEYPDANIVDRIINDEALPKLARSAVERQDGNVDTISQATVTSIGYDSSLQAAIDAAAAFDRR
ncbi:MAG: FMN-binding protein [Sporichthyaceae bacterium]